MKEPGPTSHTTSLRARLLHNAITGPAIEVRGQGSIFDVLLFYDVSILLCFPCCCVCGFFCTCCCFVLFVQTNKNLKPTNTYGNLRNLQEPANIQQNTETYSTNVHTTQQYFGRAEGNPACTTSLRASGRLATWGGGQRARPKAIEVRDQGVYFSCFVF